MLNIGTILLHGDDMNILNDTKLLFLNIGKYDYMYTDENDFSNKPRPFFSIGMIINGHGHIYTDSTADIDVFPGDIIVIPYSATYGSKWTGDPNITYITFHFIPENGFNTNIPVQKIIGLKHLTDDFKYAYDNFTIPSQSYRILSIFYGVLNDVFSKIIISSKKPLNKSIKKALDYLTVNYKENITIKELAEISNLSESRFFTVFKNETGMTPIEYKKRIAARNAEKMLITTDYSIEEISEKLGFNSTSYFRRTFRQFTGKSPREYKKGIKTGFKL